MSYSNDPIFIFGIPRCGSTVWANILEKNSELLRIREIRFLDPYQKDFKYLYNKLNKLRNNDDINELLNRIFSNELPNNFIGFWYDLQAINNKKLKKNLFSKLKKSDRTCESVFKILIEEYLNYYDADRFFIKFPANMKHIKTLKKWYPNSKILHITRDPRAIAISKTNDPGGTNKLILKYPLLKFIIRKIMILFVIYQYHLSSRIHLENRDNEDYKLFTFEDLILKPRQTITLLCDFLDLKFEENMLRPNKGEKSSITGEKRNGFDIETLTRWKSKITNIEYRIILIFTIKSMKILGYRVIG